MMQNIYSGKFIVIEGLDGSGKSAQIELLANFLKERGKNILITKEPTIDSDAGRKIKQILRGEVSIAPMELQKLYAQDRKEHLENRVIPALKNGWFVVSSRYVFSSFTYGYSEGLDIVELIKMNEEFLLPDLTIIVNVSPEQCIERIKGRGSPNEYFEKLEKLKKVNETYLKIPEMFENIFVANGENSVRNVFEEIKKIASMIL